MDAGRHMGRMKIRIVFSIIVRRIRMNWLFFPSCPLSSLRPETFLPVGRSRWPPGSLHRWKGLPFSSWKRQFERGTASEIVSFHCNVTDRIMDVRPYVPNTRCTPCSHDPRLTTMLDQKSKPRALPVRSSCSSIRQIPLLSSFPMKSFINMDVVRVRWW